MIIVIVGPTGVGKTKLSIELAKRYNAEVINADSMQVYKNLNIGTAKVREEEKENIPHHLFDICEIKDVYTVADYQKDCRSKIDELQKKNKNIIIVGGTGLYIRAALYDYNFPKVEWHEYENLSNLDIVKKIEDYNQVPYSHINNRRRLVAQLNKLDSNIKPETNGNKKLYDFKVIGLTAPRDILYKKINDRVDTMIKDGLLEEVNPFYDEHIYTKAIETGIGYKELYSYFNGSISLEEAIELIKKNSRRYAKRQYTFFNNQMSVKWFNTNYEDFSKTINEVCKYIENK